MDEGENKSRKNCRRETTEDGERGRMTGQGGREGGKGRGREMIPRNSSIDLALIFMVQIYFLKFSNSTSN